MAFSEALKARVRRKAHLSCCLCKSLGVEVHHIIPQEESGPDTEENAAPLCPSCHETYGANPQKRKFIREARDLWYEICLKRFASDPQQLDEIKALVKRTVTTEDLITFKDELLAQMRSSLPPPLPARTTEQQDEGESASGALHYDVRKQDDGVEIWLWEKERTEAVKLCDSCGWGNLKVHFAPDNGWIVVQDGGSSMGIDLRLFRQTNGAEFAEVDNAEISDKAERLAFSAGGISDGSLHHRYAQCLAWSQDSASILIRVSGYGNGLGIDSRGEETYCVAFGMNWMGAYNLETGEVTADLSRFNRKAAASWHVEN